MALRSIFDDKCYFLIRWGFLGVLLKAGKRDRREIMSCVIIELSCLQEGKYKRAALQYKKIVSWLEHESGLSEEEESKAKSLRLAAHLNLAMCHLKLKEYSQALENCNKVVGVHLLNCTSSLIVCLALNILGTTGQCSVWSFLPDVIWVVWNF